MKRTVLPMVMLAAGACASHSGSDDLSKLRRRVDELSQKQSAGEQRIEDAQNRLLLLEDKLDTTRVALQRKPDRAFRLPVVKLRPQQELPPEADANTRSHALEARTVGEDTADSADAGPTPAEDPDSVRIPGRGTGSSLVSNESVEYSGAALASQPRPVLRLRGRGAGVVRGGGSTGEAFDPAAVREKLPVTPVASKRVAHALSVAPATTSTGSEVTRAYQQAFAEYRRKRYAAAVELFRDFADRYGKHDYADNALYWLGECFYDQKKFERALEAFRRVVKEHPTGNKAPAALLKMGYSYLQLDDKQNARAVLAQVVEIFPGTEVARLASAKLSALH